MPRFLVFSRFNKLSARRRKLARFSAAWPVRARLWSSPKQTSRVQCCLFSISQWHALRPGQKTLQKLLRVPDGKNPVERVMRGNPVAQPQKSFKPILFGSTKFLHIVEALCRAQQGAEGDDQHVDQIMIFSAIDSRIGQIFKVFDETQFRMLLHPTLFQHISVKHKAKFARLPNLFRCVSSGTIRAPHLQLGGVCG